MLTAAIHLDLPCGRVRCLRGKEDLRSRIHSGHAGPRVGHAGTGAGHGGSGYDG